MSTAARPLRLPAIALAAISLAAILFSGCAKRLTAVEEAYKTHTLLLGNLTEPRSLDPHIITSLQDSRITLALFEGLTQMDPQDLHPVPGVAERWDHSDDLKTWTFHLRADAKWSNGDPVTAGDFVYSMRRILSPGLASEYSYMLYAIRNAQEFNQGKISDASQVGVEAVDDRTLVLHLIRPVAYLPSLAFHQSWYPVHRATIEKYGKMDQPGTQWIRPGNLVGNGPFNLSEWKPNTVIKVVKSQTYWNKAEIKLNGIDFLPIENEATEEAAFKSGQLHITATIPIDKIAVYKATQPQLLHQDTQLSTYFYRFNTTRPPLNDVRVRRALSMAINRKDMVEHVTKGGQPPAYNLTPPETAGYTARAMMKEDLAEAKRLLAEAGYPDGRGFPEIEVLYNTNNGHRTIAEAIQQMWKTNLGINVRLANQEAKVWEETMLKMDYQIGRYAWSGDYLDPSTFLELMTSTSGNNLTGWKNPEYDRLVALGGNTADQARRYEYYQQAEKILMDDMPIAPIYFYTRNDLILPSVKGWYGNLLDMHPYAGVTLAP